MTKRRIRDGFRRDRSNAAIFEAGVLLVLRGHLSFCVWYVTLNIEFGTSTPDHPRPVSPHVDYSMP